jgi:quercetin dioxygenase-like cupin family protein
LHLAPAELRAVRNGDALVRFAVLGPLAYVDAECPRDGHVPPSTESCERAHYGVVLEGRFELERDGRRRRIDAGTAFHVAAGAAHRHHVGGPVRVVAFEPVDDGDLSDQALRRLGLTPATAGRGSGLPLPARPVPPSGRVEADVVVLGERLLTISRFGPRSGYTSDYCDLPHWGTVVSGSVTIEWEDDVEVLFAGDVFQCPSGPPGHRMLAADPATVIDLTPTLAVEATQRQIDWRRAAIRAALESRSNASADPVALQKIV